MLETFHVLEIKLHHAEERRESVRKEEVLNTKIIDIYIVHLRPGSTANMLVFVVCLIPSSV
jgi:hypothetical protein